MIIKLIPVIVFTVIIACIIGMIVVDQFVNVSKEKRVENVKKWLRFAVYEAEKKLGSKTGQLKLAMVYDLAVKKFPWIVNYMTYEEFEGWVDEALIWMNHQIESNPAAANYILGE